MLFRSLFAATALLVALPAAAQDQGAAIQTAAAAFVKPTNAERMAVIVDQLTAAGLPHEVQTFEGGNQRTGSMAGSNVVVTLGDGP
ncbi:Zn-dependent exopeptidase M28, partial [Klebsiella pneumoniae]|nr:Zn-dependent exopeptidase M28 [Klebsiella pneumoniae]